MLNLQMITLPLHIGSIKIGEHMQKLCNFRSIMNSSNIVNEQAASNNDYITSSYWLYQDWGAHAKAVHLEAYEFLKVSKYCMKFSFFPYTIDLSFMYRCTQYYTLSATSANSASRNHTNSYSYNSTLQRRIVILVKR